VKILLEYEVDEKTLYTLTEELHWDEPCRRGRIQGTQLQTVVCSNRWEVFNMKKKKKKTGNERPLKAEANLTPNEDSATVLVWLGRSPSKG